MTILQNWNDWKKKINFIKQVNTYPKSEKSDMNYNKLQNQTWRKGNIKK